MIEPAREQDGPAIVKIAERAGNFTPLEVATVQELWDAAQSQGSAASGYYFIVYREGERVGGFACYGPTSLTEGTYDLFWIAVDPDFRRRGLGRELMRWVEEKVARLGGHLLVVETSGSADYAPTRDFYLSCGYQAEATIRDFYGIGDDLVIFTKHFST